MSTVTSYSQVYIGDPLFIPTREPVSLPVVQEVLESYKMTSQVNPTEGLGRAAIRRADRAIKKAALAALVKDHELQFVYLRRRVWDEYEVNWSEPDPYGGVVIAYKVPRGGGNVVEVSTSLCSEKDLFDKLEGKFLAANNFASGAKIKVKLAEPKRWGQQLTRMFEHE